MNSEFKFEIGDKVRIINVNGPLHNTHPKGIILKDLIGKECLITDREESVLFDDYYYNLSFDSDKLIVWKFHEYNLEKTNSLDYNSIIHKAFGIPC